MEETIRLFVDSADMLRVHHTFAFEGIRFLTLRYETTARKATPEAL